jgi:ABC-type amino acid transport substrate-binding protein
VKPWEETWKHNVAGDVACRHDHPEGWETVIGIFRSADDERADARATLAAAAPDLYRETEALVDALDRTLAALQEDGDSVDVGAMYERIAKANAALRKARGEAP